MENQFGRDVQIYRDVVIRKSVLGEETVVGDDVFITDSQIGKKCTIERRGMIFSSSIGDYSFTGYNAVVVYAMIGKFCSISWNVSIGGADHDYKCITTHPFPFKPRYGIVDEGGHYTSFEIPLQIGNDVWIASNAVITRGVKIGDGAVVGAGAVVTHDIAPYEIWTGVPARKIGQRFSDEIIQELCQLPWWNLPTELLKTNIQLFREHNVTMDTIKEIKKLF